jgi:ectoine hydrolase
MFGESMSQREHQMDEAISTRIREVARTNGWDAVVLLSPENFAYATGFVVPSQPLMRWRHAAVIIPVDDAPTLVVVDMETRTVADHLPAADVRTYGEFTRHPMDALADAIVEKKLGKAVLGVELGYLSALDADRLRPALPGATLVPCDAPIARARVVKTPAEIDQLRDLSRLTDATILDALTSVRAGSTEMDIAAGLTAGIFSRGAHSFKLMIVASGERSGYPNVGPTERVLQPGDLVRAEIFGFRDGYHAGVCRTAVVGPPDAEQERVWSVILRCRDLVLDQIRPGASAAAVYRSFSEVFAAEGLPAIDFVGHGIGVHLHEEPYLGRYGDATLEAGMVLGIEPLVYSPGKGMQNKDMVLVTDDGCELLSSITPAERLVEIPA